MKKEELNIDKAVRQKLKGFSQEPPLHVWNNIQGLLVEQRRKKRIVLFSRIAAAAVILIAFMAGWYLNERSEEIVSLTTQNENIETETQNPEIENELNDAHIETVLEESLKDKEEPITTQSFLNVPIEMVATVENRKEGSEIAELGFVERFSMKMLEGIDAFFEIDEKEKLSVKAIQNQYKSLSQAEKILVAENLKTIEDSENEVNRWKLGLHISPGYSSQNSSYSDAYLNNMTYSDESGNSNMGGGFSVQYKTGKKWSIESGVYYAQNGQRSSNSLGLRSLDSFYGSSPQTDFTEKSYFNTGVNVVDGQLAMNSSAGIIEFHGNPEGTELVADFDESPAESEVILASGEFSQVFDFVEIPLFMRYSVIDSKIGIDLMGGVNAGIITGNKVFMESQYGNQNVGKTQDISSVNLSGTVGVGLNYALGEHFSLTVEPRLNYYFNSINQNSDVSYRPYRIGVFTGLYYEF